VVLLVATILAGCSSDAPFQGERRVQRSDFGDEWPLTDEAGVLSCETGAVTFDDGDRKFAVNGIARSRGFPALDSILAEQQARDFGRAVESIKEDQRRQIFESIAKCQSFAERRSERVTTEPGEQIAEERRLAGACRTGLQRRHKLSDAEYLQIKAEGEARRWPPLTPLRADINSLLRAGMELCTSD
jgi:hypothetical protein